MTMNGTEVKFRNMGPLNASTSGEAASLVVKASAGVLFGFFVYNNKTTAQFIQVHNTATVVADTAVPIMNFEIAAQTGRTLEFGAHGRAFSTGIMICNSSTDTTKTIGSADCIIDAQYI